VSRAGESFADESHQKAYEESSAFSHGSPDFAPSTDRQLLEARRFLVTADEPRKWLNAVFDGGRAWDLLMRTMLAPSGRLSSVRPIVLACLMLGAFSAAAAAASATITASYSIAIAGIPVGKAQATSRFQGSTYSLSLTGSTSGVSRIFSDTSAKIESSGQVNGKQMLASRYTMETTENGSIAHVAVRLSSGSVLTVAAVPPLPNRPGRIPVSEAHLQNIVDPISALIFPSGGSTDGQAACARTARVFDGWSRFDVRLSYRETRTLEGDTGAAAKSAFVCAARFVPVAGHIPDSDSVKFMSENKNIEIWLAQVGTTEFLIPYRIQIGTMIGDLTIRATSIALAPNLTRASAD